VQLASSKVLMIMEPMMQMPQAGIVVIGRNEGQRLVDCLESVFGCGYPVVYVDSGSTDGSVEKANAMGATVLGLDMSQPFTAARARNAGFNKLVQLYPSTQFVQFVDGDSQLNPGWMGTAINAIQDNPRWAIVCGRLRESRPEESIYTRLSDIDWHGPIGQVNECGGIFMVRRQAFESVVGFNPSLIAGEEPEMCVRMRQRGWQINRLNLEMARHNAAMTRFSQWWIRTVRTGYAFAQGAMMHGQSPQRHYVQPLRSCVSWALILPLVIVLAAWPTGGWSLVLMLCYPVQSLKITVRTHYKGRSWQDSTLYGAFIVIGKFAEIQGMFRYATCHFLNRQPTIIEHKEVDNRKLAPRTI